MAISIFEARNFHLFIFCLLCSVLAAAAAAAAAMMAQSSGRNQRTDGEDFSVYCVAILVEEEGFLQFVRGGGQGWARNRDSLMQQRQP